MVGSTGLHRYVIVAVVVVWALMVCQTGQLFVIHDPMLFLAKSEQNMSNMMLGSGGIHLPLSSLSLELEAQCVTLVMS